MTGKPRAGHGAKPAAVREQAIVALLSEPSIGKAAAACGIGEKTLRRWLTDDAAFKAEFEAARPRDLPSGDQPDPGPHGAGRRHAGRLARRERTPRRPARGGADDWDAPAERVPGAPDVTHSEVPAILRCETNLVISIAPSLRFFRSSGAALELQD